MLMPRAHEHVEVISAFSSRIHRSFIPFQNGKIARKFVRSQSISLSGADGKRTVGKQKYHAHMCMSKVLRFGIRFHHRRTNVRHTGPLEAKQDSCGGWFAIYVCQKSFFSLPRHRFARPVCECVPYRSTFMIECSTSPGRLATYAVSR